MVTVREIVFYKDYFIRFYSEQTTVVQEKIEYVFKLIQEVNRIPDKFIRHLTDIDGLYEIRVKAGSTIYRIFCCFDDGNLVVLFNAFNKKSQKTPQKEILLAQKLMKDYFLTKNR